jgi:DNA repair protein RadA/Sms|tara:strand:+ start:64 stop:828 length:765 start_codon:yes stop_codon:yes gene_type:complete
VKLNVKTDHGFGTNILDIEVPKELRKKIKSGLDYVDAAFGGSGFTPSCVTLFTGTPGSGKTTMMLKLADSLTKQGAVVLFNTAEESLYQVKLVAERLNLKHGFAAGGETHMPSLLEQCDKLRNKPGNKKKPFFLIVDSLQCMDDGKYTRKDGSTHINGGSATRSLGMMTNYCKEHFCNAIVIGQVNKSGNMAGSQKLKHMVDSMMTLSVEERDADLRGCRVLQMVKNRFGGAGGTFFLALNKRGFKEVARVSAA